ASGAAARLVPAKRIDTARANRGARVTGRDGAMAAGRWAMLREERSGAARSNRRTVLQTRRPDDGSGQDGRENQRRSRGAEVEAALGGGLGQQVAEGGTEGPR